MYRLVVALVRHGDYHQRADTPSAHQPFSLNSAGEVHAALGASELRALLAKHRLALHPTFDSSTLLRAWQTARIMADALSSLSPDTVRIESHDALTERCVGSAANLSVPEIEQALAADPRHEPPPPGWKANSHYRLPFPGAESLMEAGERVARQLRTRALGLRQEIRQDTLWLCVGHGAAFRHAACQLGALREAQIPGLSMYHGRPVLLECHPEEPWLHLDGAWKQRAVDGPHTD